MTTRPIRSILPLIVAALCASPVVAQQAVTFETVKEAIADGPSTPRWKKAFLDRVLVTSEPELDRDSDNYDMTFIVSDYEVVNGDVRVIDGSGIRVRIESYYSGSHLWDEDNDDPHEYEVGIKAKKGDIVSLAGHLTKNWDDDTWELGRTFEGDMWSDNDLYDTFAEGFDSIEDYGYLVETLNANWGVTDLDEFSEDGHTAGANDLDDFNDLLVQLGYAKITRAGHIHDRLDDLDDVNYGISAPITVHENNVQPVALEPSIVYVRPYADLRQNTVVVVKVTNAGLFPRLRLGRYNMTIDQRLPGMLIVRIPRRARTGRRLLTLVNDAGNRSKPFPVYVKRFVAAQNPAPVLKSATVVGTPAESVLVLEGRHFRQGGAVSVYLGRRKLSVVVRREHNVVIAKIPAGSRGRVARIRVGRQTSNSVDLGGGSWMSAPTTTGSSTAGAVGALGALGN